jgi:predicted Zn-dependent protease
MFASFVPIYQLEGMPVKVLHPRNRRVILLACALVCLARATHAWPRDASLPTGVCGGPEHMAGALEGGHVMLQQALAAGMPWGGARLNEYVNRLGQNLARSSGSQQNFTFYVLYNPDVNAQAFPGGFVVVNSGVISTAENEAELASVLSHEIAHVNACDWRTSSWKANLIELLVMVPAVTLAGPVGIALTSASGWVAPVARARFTRSAERRADRLAVQYLVREGYDPRAAVSMFARLEEEQSAQGLESGGVLATHPRVSDRRKNVEKFLPRLPPPEFVPHDEAEFLSVRKDVRDYDEVYSRAVGARVPGREPPPPVLTHRPPEATLP